MKKIISILISICILLSTAIPVMAAGTTVAATPITPAKTVATALVPINLELALTKTELKQGETLGFNISILQGDKARSGQSLTVQLIDTREMQIQMGEWETGVDGKYSGKFTLPLNSTAGVYKVVTTTYDDADVPITKTALFNVLASSMLNHVQVSVDAATYLPQNEVKITGTADTFKGGELVKGTEVSIKVTKGTDVLFTKTVTTNSKGAFAVVYPTIELPGDYTVTATAGLASSTANFKVIDLPTSNRVKVSINASIYNPETVVKITGTAETFKGKKLVAGTEVTVTVTKDTELLFTEKLIVNNQGKFATTYTTTEVSGNYVVTATAGSAKDMAYFYVKPFAIMYVLTAKTDKTSYKAGALATFSGQAKILKGQKVQPNTKVKVTLYKDGRVVKTTDVLVNADNSYSFKTDLSATGNYTFVAQLGNQRVDKMVKVVRK